MKDVELHFDAWSYYFHCITATVFISVPADKSQGTLNETTVGVLPKNLRTRHSSLFRSRIMSSKTTRNIERLTTGWQNVTCGQKKPISLFLKTNNQPTNQTNKQTQKSHKTWDVRAQAVSCFSPRRPSFDPRPVHIGLVVVKQALGEVFLVLRDLSFHQCSILIRTSPTL